MNVHKGMKNTRNGGEIGKVTFLLFLKICLEKATIEGRNNNNVL